MYDFNCDVAQSYGVYKNDNELELAKYMSTINVSAGFHAGDPVNIRKSLLFASENNVALSAHVGYPDIQGFGKRKMNLSTEELQATVIYQLGAIISYAKTFDLELEAIRCHGALKDDINENEQIALCVAEAVKKINPWLNIIVQNPNIKELLEQNGYKAAYEVDFKENTSIREIREMAIKPDTIHFRTLDEAKRAYDIIKPTPINYNRVQGQI